MERSDFDFLKDGTHDELHDIITGAEQHYAHSDSVVSLFRARQFMEFLVLGRFSAEISHLRGDRKYPDLEIVIDNLRKVGEITKTQFDRLTFVRIHGNEAVHKNLGQSHLAHAALKECYSLALDWLWPGAGGPKPSHDSYQPPPRPVTVRRSIDPVSPPRAWIIRPYPNHEDCSDIFLHENIMAIGWNRLGELSSTISKEMLARRLAALAERAGIDLDRYRLERDLETILLFLKEIRKCDLVVMAPYSDRSKLIAIGQVRGRYEFRKSESKKLADCAQQRKVKWFPEFDRKLLPETVRRNIRKLTLVETNANDLLAFCREQGYKLVSG